MLALSLGCLNRLTFLGAGLAVDEEEHLSASSTGGEDLRLESMIINGEETETSGRCC